MRMTLLRGLSGIAVAILATAALAPVAFASPLDTMSIGSSIDAKSFVGPMTGDDYILVNPAVGSKLHGSGLADLDSVNLVAMNDSALDPALVGVWSDNVFTVKHGLGVPLGYGIDVIPAALGDIAMVKEDACAVPVDSGGVLAISAGYKLDVAKTLGHVLAIGALGWTGSSSAIPAGCNVNDAQLPGLAVG